MARGRFSIPTIVLAVCACLGLAWHAREARDGGWELARGYEFEWIAHPLSQGHGYTFGGPWAWLGPYEDTYAPTAWVEPLPTAIMALAFAGLGERGRLVLVILNYVLFAAVCAMLFVLARRIVGSLAGYIVVTGFVAFGPGKQELFRYIGNSTLATALVTASALSLHSALERPSVHKSLGLGLLLGFLALTSAVTLLFAPFAAAALLFASATPRRQRLTNAATMLLTTAAVMLPWSMRNAVVFGEFVPVRTGLGQNMHYALPAAAQTIQPDIFGDAWNPPPWTASSAREAVSRMKDVADWRLLAAHSLEMGKAAAPQGYDQLNEAERDAIYAQESRAFVVNHPLMTARLAAAKLHGFFWANWPDFRIVTALAIVGGICAVRRRRLLPVLGLVGLYVMPYILSAPLYYRYRAPIEPLLFLLAVVPLSGLTGWIGERLSGRVQGGKLGFLLQAWKNQFDSGAGTIPCNSPRSSAE